MMACDEPTITFTSGIRLQHVLRRLLAGVRRVAALGVGDELGVGRAGGERRLEGVGAGVVERQRLQALEVRDVAGRPRLAGLDGRARRAPCRSRSASRRRRRCPDLRLERVELAAERGERRDDRDALGGRLGGGRAGADGVGGEHDVDLRVALDRLVLHRLDLGGAVVGGAGEVDELDPELLGLGLHGLRPRPG